MRRILVPIAAIFAALAVPAIPFVACGPALEGWLEATVRGVVDRRAAALVVIGLLSTDVLLPIPSSVLSTLGGEVLGFGLGTGVSFAGLMAGSVLGFGLARVAGRPLVSRLASPEDVAHIEILSGRLGPMVLAVTRPVPIFAEAAVLFFGATGLGWRRFLAPVALTNLAIAAAYSALGAWVHLPFALVVSIAVPVLATWIARRAMRSRSTDAEG